MGTEESIFEQTENESNKHKWTRLGLWFVQWGKIEFRIKWILKGRWCLVEDTLRWIKEYFSDGKKCSQKRNIKK